MDRQGNVKVGHTRMFSISQPVWSSSVTDSSSSSLTLVSYIPPSASYHSSLISLHSHKADDGYRVLPRRLSPTLLLITDLSDDGFEKCVESFRATTASFSHPLVKLYSWLRDSLNKPPSWSNNKHVLEISIISHSQSPSLTLYVFLRLCLVSLICRAWCALIGRHQSCENN